MSDLHEEVPHLADILTQFAVHQGARYDLTTNIVVRVNLTSIVTAFTSGDVPTRNFALYTWICHSDLLPHLRQYSRRWQHGFDGLVNDQHVSRFQSRYLDELGAEVRIASAVRYAGATFAYTSVAVLLNYSQSPSLALFNFGSANLANSVTSPPRGVLKRTRRVLIAASRTSISI